MEQVLDLVLDLMLREVGTRQRGAVRLVFEGGELPAYEKQAQVIALDSSASLAPGRIDLLLYDGFDEQHS